MDNFKFKVNGIQTNIQAVSEPYHPFKNNGYGIGNISGFNATTSSPGFQVDGTNGQAGNATCNEYYMKNSYDIFKSIGGFSSNLSIPNDYGALARYHFFSSNQSGTYNFNNIAIPGWASYIRVFLIGAGGGGGGAGGGGGGGAGEFVFMESKCTGGSTYSIQIGQGGSGSSSGGGSAGGGTALYNIGNEPIGAEGGSGGPLGAGGSTPVWTYPTAYPVALYTRTDDAIVIRAKGEKGSPVAGGQRTHVQYNNYNYSLDSWFGFEMSGSTQQQLVHEMINAGYGRGGNQYGSTGENGCACVFYFGVKPSHLVFPQGFYSNIYSDGT